MANPVPINVLVVDDSTFMRGALVRMIERDPRLKVVDVALNGEEGVRKARELRPDVITMDIEMPVMNGLDALKEIMATVRIPVVMISTLTEHGAEATLKAMELGAVDFIPKSLNDKDKNIFRGSEEIHQKLLAAAGVRLGDVRAAEAPVAPLKPLAVAARNPARLLVVGSSTGGPKALHQFLHDLPPSLPVPVVIAQHMPADFTRVLARRLDESCKLTVREVVDGERLLPGTVYVAPGGKHLRVVGGVAQIADNKGESPYSPSVDVLGESVLLAYQGQVLAVLLTGMGDDGARAFKALHDAGAYVIAQDRDSCVVYGMPRVLVDNGGATEVLDLRQIAERVRQLLNV